MKVKLSEKPQSWQYKGKEELDKAGLVTQSIVEISVLLDFNKSLSGQMVDSTCGKTLPYHDDILEGIEGRTVKSTMCIRSHTVVTLSGLLI